ncbi:MAG: hypothetical protein J7K36_01975 [Archaeoglobaceae archaeon]|nr:hypothetical protein [Archaeoglobaceae archaeon]
MSNIKLSKIHRAIMFISTKNLSEELENKVKEAIERKVENKLRFVGRCFGRFDMVAEFDDRSAKVASRRVCKIQESAAKELENLHGLRDPICSSLMLCNEFLVDGEKSVDELDYIPPTLKLYSFLYPRKTQVNLEEVLTELEKVKENLASIEGGANLFFSSSNYAFLLTISGNMFCKMFEQFL